MRIKTLCLCLGLVMSTTPMSFAVVKEELKENKGIVISQSINVISEHSVKPISELTIKTYTSILIPELKKVSRKSLDGINEALKKIDNESSLVSKALNQTNQLIKELTYSKEKGTKKIYKKYGIKYNNKLQKRHEISRLKNYAKQLSQKLEKLGSTSKALKNAGNYFKKGLNARDVEMAEKMVGLGVSAVFSIGMNIWDNNSIQNEAKQLEEEYPSLKGKLEMTYLEYWTRFSKNLVTDIGTAATVSIIGVLSKVASSVVGGFVLYFSDIPTTGMEVHTRMPDIDTDREQFFKWLRFMGENSDKYLSYVTEQDRTGEKLTIPLGMLDYWRLMDLSASQKDPKMSWIHYDWKLYKNFYTVYSEPCTLPNFLSDKNCMSNVSDNDRARKAENERANRNRVLDTSKNKLIAQTSHIGSNNIILQNNKSNQRQTIQENPYLAKGSTIIEAPADIVLNWGANPADLDSHLTGPMGNNSQERFHVNFTAKGALDNQPNVLLYRDYTNHRSGGENLPEQTRINVTQPGIYNFYVHDYSNRNNENNRALSQSGAVVTVHTAGSRELPEGQNLGKEIARYSVPQNKEGTVWHSFELDTRRNTIREVGTFHKTTESIK